MWNGSKDYFDPFHASGLHIMMKTRKGNSMAKVSTYRAMISALVCTFLCVAMLCGMTYAWYLGSIDSGNNTIKIGAYNVTLKSYDGSSSFTDSVSSTTSYTVTGLGPGGSETYYFQVENKNDYAVNAKLSVIPVSKAADIQIFCSEVSNASQEPTGDAVYDFANVTDAEIATPTPTQIFTGSVSANSTKIVAVKVMLPDNSVAANASTGFKLKFDIEQPHS